MAKKQPVQQQDTGISSVQKMITLCMLAFMGYLFFMQDRHIQNNPQAAIGTAPVNLGNVIPQQTPLPEAIKVKITDTDSGSVSYSDLRKGKIIIGKWEMELDEPKTVVDIEKPVELDLPKPAVEVDENIEVQFEPDQNSVIEDILDDSDEIELKAPEPKPAPKSEPASTSAPAPKKSAPKADAKKIETPKPETEKPVVPVIEKPTIKAIE